MVLVSEIIEKEGDPIYTLYTSEKVSFPFLLLWQLFVIYLFIHQWVPWRTQAEMTFQKHWGEDRAQAFGTTGQSAYEGFPRETASPGSSSFILLRTVPWERLICEPPASSFSGGWGMRAFILKARLCHTTYFRVVRTEWDISWKTTSIVSDTLEILIKWQLLCYQLISIEYLPINKEGT